MSETRQAAPGPAQESRSLWSDARARLVRNPVAMAGGGIVILLVLVAILAPYIAPYDPLHQDLANSMAGPSMAHLAGTDVEWLDRATHEVPRHTDKLAAFHRSRITTLLYHNQCRLEPIRQSRAHEIRERDPGLRRAGLFGHVDLEYMVQLRDVELLVQGPA